MVKLRIAARHFSKRTGERVTSISIELRDAGRRRFIPTGVIVPIACWDIKERVVKSNYQGFVEVNIFLQQRLRTIKQIRFDLLVEGVDPGIDDIRKRYFNRESPKLVDWMKSSIKEDNSVTEQTKLVWSETVKKLESFAPDVRMNQVHYRFVERFDTFLRRQRLSNNTVAKHHRCLRRFLNTAIKRRQYPTGAYPYKAFKIRIDRTRRGFLSIGELQQLEKLECSTLGKTDLQVLRMYLLSCYTGLRKSDLIRLHKDHIKETPEGLSIELKTKKSGKYAVIPIHALFPCFKGGNETKPERLTD